MSPLENNLLAAVRNACQPTYVPTIEAGRQAVLALPREWVVANIEGVVATGLDLSDYWHYRRLLELYSLLDGALVDRLVKAGLLSADPEIAEAARDFGRPA
jgi:hypothetical protein